MFWCYFYPSASKTTHGSVRFLRNVLFYFTLNNDSALNVLPCLGRTVVTAEANTQHVPSIHPSDLQHIDTEFVKSLVFNCTWGKQSLAENKNRGFR